MLDFPTSYALESTSDIALKPGAGLPIPGFLRILPGLSVPGANGSRNALDKENVMEIGETMMWWPESALHYVGLVVATLLVMYLGRQAAHGTIRALCAALGDLFERGRSALTSAQERLTHRNREVLLELGREQTERSIEREFHRVNAIVARDLSGYPGLNRRIADQIQQIDEDFQASTDVPPTPPAWTEAVAAIANVPAAGDPVVARILGDIQKTIEQSEKNATSIYRKASRERHLLLKRMLPFWRQLTQILQQVGGTVSGLAQRAEVIDRQMDTYEEIREKTDRATRMLSSSTMTHFIASSFVLVIALLGGFVNFHLIALPMSEMVGATSYVGPVKTSDIAALVVILMEIAMGLFLMESLKITKLFPVIHTMDDAMRKRLIWASGSILLTLACVESSLAYMRDILAADREALNQVLSGMAATQPELRWIPSVGQMVMGFVLPFALAFAAIPLESFISSSRIAAGNVLALVMRLLATMLDLSANFITSLGSMFIHVYDFMIMVPLRVEQVLTARNGSRPRREARENQPAEV